MGREIRLNCEEEEHSDEEEIFVQEVFDDERKTAIVRSTVIQQETLKEPELRDGEITSVCGVEVLNPEHAYSDRSCAKHWNIIRTITDADTQNRSLIHFLVPL